MIVTKNLTISYQGKSVLEDVSHTFSTHTLLLGANGSGKSSLAKALCDFVPFQGEIFYHDTALSSLSQKQKSSFVAYIPPELESFDEEITLFEYLLHSLYMQKKGIGYAKAQHKKVQECIKSFDLIPYRRAKLKDLSSGYKALAQIASASLLSSEWIIFDEPTANLDPKKTLFIAKKLQELKREKRILLITHDLDFAHFFGADVAFLMQKRLFSFKHQDFFDDTTLAKLYGCSFANRRLVYA